MEDKIIDVLQKISESNDKIGCGVVALAILGFIVVIGFGMYKMCTIIYEGGKEDGKKGK